MIALRRLVRHTLHLLLLKGTTPPTAANVTWTTPSTDSLGSMPPGNGDMPRNGYPFHPAHCARVNAHAA